MMWDFLLWSNDDDDNNYNDDYEYDDYDHSSFPGSIFQRYLSVNYSHAYEYFSNHSRNGTWAFGDDSIGDDFTANFNAASDVSVDAVVYSLYFNGCAFVFLMASYEVLRRMLPAVYSSKIKRQYKSGIVTPSGEFYINSANQSAASVPALKEQASMSPSQSSQRSSSPPPPPPPPPRPFVEDRRPRHERIFSLTSMDSIEGGLPEVFNSFSWAISVFNVPWPTVRRSAGLDGYFFLRFIRMNLRICAVTSFWAVIILMPIYATGTQQRGEKGWYHISVSNVSTESWRMWVPGIFAYLFTGFIFFVMKQEYRHFLELRMDFLARGTSHVHPQHHYSLQVENIPYALRSDKALFDYFDKIFPGKVHSASVVLNLPDLEAVKARSMRVCRRLEKSIAHSYATGNRPTHNVGSPRMNILGVDLAPFDWSCGSYPDVAYVDDRSVNERPARGTHVDSISYYTYDLADTNKDMYIMQRRKTEIALTGNISFEADNWLSQLMISAYEVADQIMVDSAEDNALRTNYSFTGEETGGGRNNSSSIPQAELMSSYYGSVGPKIGMSPRTAQCQPYAQWHVKNTLQRLERSLNADEMDDSPDLTNSARVRIAARMQGSGSGSSSNKSVTMLLPNTSSEEQLLPDSPKTKKPSRERYKVPGSSQHQNLARRIAGRLGLDFLVAGVKFANRQLDHAMESVVGATMSSTGFVTFLDLTSVTAAASAPLTSKPQVLEVSVAPEPRDIIWENAHVSAKTRDRHERIVNFFLFLGVFFWIFPLAAIQAFAKAEFIAQIPGMEWILTSGAVSNFVNGYLPVIALLTLILILPVIFEFVARKYERRKTISDVQRSMLGRYFYYQVANIYITVTAGSLWRSLSEILDHPTSLLELLGESLPTMVGYFVALLVTKILAGLPIVFLRVGALSRMLLLRSLSSQKNLTQRELDQIYRPENVQYGWEFPSQLLVIMIVFTYAIICPIIVPVGMTYFAGSLIVYKKQVLYVYQPVYESGGAMFPYALQRTLFGLVCGQLTLIGYLLTRGCYFQPIFLIPLPVFTIWGMSYFYDHYAKPSAQLSLERAREFDRVCEVLASEKISISEFGSMEEKTIQLGIEARRSQFDKNSYRQPVLAAKPSYPINYRRDQMDTLTEEVRMKLQNLQEATFDAEIGGGGADAGAESSSPLT